VLAVQVEAAAQTAGLVVISSEVGKDFSGTRRRFNGTPPNTMF
jgi:hypothetical protein